jgi:hypothetical protein
MEFPSYSCIVARLPVFHAGTFMAVPPRSLFVAGFRFALVGLVTTALMIGTTLLIAYSIAWFWGSNSHEPGVLAVATVCALITWLFVATFHLRRETHSMPFTQREQFIAKTKTVLNEMGYVLALQQADELSFRPRFNAYIFGGGIHVKLLEHEAKLTGPKMSLEVFRRGFRLANHGQRVQYYLQDMKKYTDNVIKRVGLQLWLNADQLDPVRKHLENVMEKDAQFSCELSIVIHSEIGIREDLLDNDLREWLEYRGIAVEVRKDLVQFVEVVQSDIDTKVAAD